MGRVLLVPGRNPVLPDHWQQRLAHVPADHHWVRHRVTDRYDPDDRLAALTEAVAAGAEPVVLVAHSAGCLTVTRWAARHDTGLVRGALLVTPPDIEEPYTEASVTFPALPPDPLPFPSIVVASRNDPVMTMDRAALWARRWGADFVDAGAVGHLSTADGYGPWPLGDELIARLRG